MNKEIINKRVKELIDGFKNIQEYKKISEEEIKIVYLICWFNKN